MRKILFLFGILLAFSVVFAETGVMIATDSNNIDFCVAQSASLKTGYPLFLAEDGTISTDVLNEIVSYAPDIVYIIGGPEAISEDTETTLSDNNLNSTRIFGISEYGTAAEVVEYFWPEGADETVVVTSSGLEGDENNTCIEAVSLASLTDSPVVVVPEEDVPSDTLDVIAELEPENITVIGEEVSEDIVASLSEIAETEEIEGTEEEISEIIEEEVADEIEETGEKAKIVIVATPDWKHALSIGALPRNNSVVKMVWNVEEQLPKIKTFIEEHNIEDIKVVGPPVLADKVKEKLDEYGINYTSYTDARPALVAKKVIAAFKDKWLEKKEQWENRTENFKEKIIEKIEDLINETEARIAEEEAYLEELKAEGKDVTELEQKLEEVKTELENVKANYKTVWKLALGRIKRALNSFMIRKWVKRAVIAWKWAQKASEEARNVLASRQEIDYSALEAEIDALEEQGVDATSLEEALEDLKSEIEDADAEAKKSLRAAMLKKIKTAYSTLRKAINVAKIKKQVPTKLANVVNTAKRLAGRIIKRLRK